MHKRACNLLHAHPQRVTCLEALMLVARRQLGLDRPSFSGGGGGGEAAGEEAAAGEDLEGVQESTEPLVRCMGWRRPCSCLLASYLPACLPAS